MTPGEAREHLAKLAAIDPDGASILNAATANLAKLVRLADVDDLDRLESAIESASLDDLRVLLLASVMVVAETGVLRRGGGR